MQIKSKAIILSSLKYGESSKIIRAYTQQSGKMSFIAKGAYAKKSKFGAALETLACSEIQYYDKSSEKLTLLINAELVFLPFNALQTNAKCVAAMCVAECLDKLIAERQVFDDVFELAETALMNIEKTNLPLSSAIYFILHLCSNLGYELQLRWRNKQHKEAENEYIWVNLKESMLYSFGVQQNNSTMKIESKVLYELKRLMPTNEFEIDIEEEMFVKMLNFLENYIDSHFESNFRFVALRTLL